MLFNLIENVHVNNVCTRYYTWKISANRNTELSHVFYIIITSNSRVHFFSSISFSWIFLLLRLVCLEIRTLFGYDLRGRKWERDNWDLLALHRSTVLFKRNSGGKKKTKRILRHNLSERYLMFSSKCIYNMIFSFSKYDPTICVPSYRNLQKKNKRGHLISSWIHRSPLKP